MRPGTSDGCDEMNVGGACAFVVATLAPEASFFVFTSTFECFTGEIGLKFTLFFKSLTFNDMRR